MRSLRTQHSTSTSGSNRRVPPPRGSSSPAHLGPHILPALALRPFSLTRRFLTPRCAACGSTFLVDPLSLLRVLRLLSLNSSMRAMYVQGGGRMCFPVRDCRCLPVSHCICHRSCPVVPRSLCLLGRPDVFSRPRLRTTSSPLLHSSILLIPTRSSCASMVWTDTAFGASGCSRTGLCGLVATHFGCPHCVSVSWIIFQLTTRGGAGSDSSGI